MHVLIQIPSGYQPISHFPLGEIFLEISGNFLPMLNFQKIYNPNYAAEASF